MYFRCFSEMWTCVPWAAPVTLDAIGVDVAAHVFARTVLDGLMIVASSAKASV
jgi:hypothetical protein